MLTSRLLLRLQQLTHSNGVGVTRIYGPMTTEDRGGTVAFNVVDAFGCVIDSERLASPTAPYLVADPVFGATVNPMRSRA